MIRPRFGNVHSLVPLTVGGLEDKGCVGVVSNDVSMVLVIFKVRGKKKVSHQSVRPTSGVY